MSAAEVKLDDPRRNTLWAAINQIPDEVLTDYLEDKIIDEQEIEDITTRLEALCQQNSYALNVTPADHALIRSLVRHAVQYILHEQSKGQDIEKKLCKTTLSDIRNVMGSLLDSGQIKLSSHEFSITKEPSPGEYIPEDRPEDYDPDEPNLVE